MLVQMTCVQTVIVLQVGVCREAKLEGIGDIFVHRLFPVHALYNETKLGSAVGSRCTCCKSKQRPVGQHHRSGRETHLHVWYNILSAARSDMSMIAR